jgi:hypothetical protein
MDVVLQEFDMGAGPDHVYTQRREPMFGGAKVANLETLDSHVAFILNRDYAGSAGGNEMRCVEDRGLAWKASKSDESIARIAGSVDTH